MNSLWDIRIFLGLAPKESHCSINSPFVWDLASRPSAIGYRYFEQRVVFIFSGGSVGYFGHWRWGQYVISKGQDLITHWRSIISRKNGFLIYTAAKTSKLSFETFFIYTRLLYLWTLWHGWWNVPEFNTKLRYVFRTVLFRVFTQWVTVISCRRFGTTYRSHLQGSVIFWILQGSRIQYLLDSWPQKMGPIGCPETSVINYHY